MKNLYTPFSTHLSGSAKETELRLRSIFQWNRGRPPTILLVLMLLLALGCGGMVSCRSDENVQHGPADQATKLVQRTCSGFHDPDQWRLHLSVYNTGDEDYSLVVVTTTDRGEGDTDDLFLGVWEEKKQRYVGDSFQSLGSALRYNAWSTPTGGTALLCSNVTLDEEQGTGQSLQYFICEGSELTRVTQLPQAALDSGVLDDVSEAHTILEDNSPVWTDYRAEVERMGFRLSRRNETNGNWLTMGYVPFVNQQNLGPEDFQMTLNGEPVDCSLTILPDAGLSALPENWGEFPALDVERAMDVPLTLTTRYASRVDRSPLYISRGALLDPRTGEKVSDVRTQSLFGEEIFLPREVLLGGDYILTFQIELDQDVYHLGCKVTYPEAKLDRAAARLEYPFEAGQVVTARELDEETVAILYLNKQQPDHMQTAIFRRQGSGFRLLEPHGSLTLAKPARPEPGKLRANVLTSWYDRSDRYITLAVAYSDDVAAIHYEGEAMHPISFKGYRLFWLAGTGDQVDYTLYNEAGEPLEQII